MRAILAIGCVALIVSPSAPVLAGGGPAAFTEEAHQRGIAYATPFVTGFHYGNGVAFADLDNDGDPDVVVNGRGDLALGIYENDGSGYFTARNEPNELPLLGVGAAVLAFDYDADGDLDLFFSHYHDPDVLLRNDGGFRFKDVSNRARVASSGFSTGASAGDFNGDGWLDLHVPAYGSVDLLYQNKGNGTFVEVAERYGVDDPWRGWQSVFFDYDRDGDADLYVSNDKRYFNETEMHNRLYENTGTAMVDVSEESGTNVNIYSMGIGVGDFKRNGWPDLYCTNLSIEPNVLLMNDGHGGFRNRTAVAGLQSFRVGWAATFFDYDNDGHMDLHVCNSGAPNRLYVHGGVWPSQDIAFQLGVDHFVDSYGAATADIDNDGDLDLMVSSLNDDIRLFVNNEGQERSWIKLRVIGPHPNLFAANAQVVVKRGQDMWYREVLLGGNSFKSHNDLTVHVGLGDIEDVDVTVRWPGIARPRNLLGLDGRETWTVYPSERLGDVDGDGQVRLHDIAAFADCRGPLRPGCEMMDFDGRDGVSGVDQSRILSIADLPPDDCDGDGMPDAAQVILVPSSDTNGNLIPDSCD